MCNVPSCHKLSAKCTPFFPEANWLHPKVLCSIFSGESAPHTLSSRSSPASRPVLFSLLQRILNGRTWAWPQEPPFLSPGQRGGSRAQLLAPNAVPTARGKGTRAPPVGDPILRCTRVSMQVTLGGDGRDTLHPLTPTQDLREARTHQPRSGPSQAGQVAPPVASARAGTLTA